MPNTNFSQLLLTLYSELHNGLQLDSTSILLITQSLSHQQGNKSAQSAEIVSQLKHTVDLILNSVTEKQSSAKRDIVRTEFDKLENTFRDNRTPFSFALSAHVLLYAALKRAQQQQQQQVKQQIQQQQVRHNADNGHLILDLLNLLLIEQTQRIVQTSHLCLQQQATRTPSLVYSSVQFLGHRLASLLSFATLSTFIRRGAHLGPSVASHLYELVAKRPTIQQQELGFARLLDILQDNSVNSQLPITQVELNFAGLVAGMLVGASASAVPLAVIQLLQQAFWSSFHKCQGMVVVDKQPVWSHFIKQFQQALIESVKKQRRKIPRVSLWLMTGTIIGITMNYFTRYLVTLFVWRYLRDKRITESIVPTGNDLFSLIQIMLQQYTSKLLFSQDFSWTLLSTLIAWKMLGQRNKIQPPRLPFTESVQEREQAKHLARQLLGSLAHGASKL